MTTFPRRTILQTVATGLPAWFLANPRRASAQDMVCAISARDRAQFLVLSASSAGDSISCNCPGTYGAPAIIHPTAASMAPTSFTLGTTMVTAAAPWAALTPAVRSRTNFFHHMTGGTVHGDHPKVMRLLGRTARGEMLPSIYAKHLARCLGTVQAEPIAVGPESLAFAGRVLSSVAPLQLKQLLTGSKTDPLVSLRKARDATLDQLNALFKTDGTVEQRRFLDAMATSQKQVRQLTEGLASTLDAIDSNDVNGQALAAAALVAARVTPVVSLHIPFGADNHVDENLDDEVFDHIDHDGSGRGVPGIQKVMDALAALKVADGTTFATMNVFGRDLSGTAKVAARGGRDHFGNHAVMVMIGKNVAPGVTGGAVPISGNVHGASDIDPATGAPRAGANVPREDSHVSAAKTLGLALGIDAGLLTADFTDNGTVKPVTAALNGVRA
jgi:hypothetical protein